MHNEGELGPNSGEGMRHRRYELRRENAHDLSRRTRRIREGSEHIEDGSDSDLSARSDGVPHRGVKDGREEEANPDLVEAMTDDLRRGFDVHAQRSEHIRAAAPARYGAVAVLGHSGAGACRDESGCRRDVEGIEAVPACAARVDYRACRTRYEEGAIPHDLGEGRDLIARLALHAHGGQERPDLGVGALPTHDRGHGRPRHILREVSPCHQ